MLKGLISLSLATGLISFSSFAGQKTFAEYWSDTGFKISTVIELGYLNRCRNSIDQFRGCIAMINALGEGQKGLRIHLMPNSLVGQPGQKSGKVLRVFGALSLVQLNKSSNPKTSGKKDWLNQVEANKKMVTELEHIRKGPIDFLKIVNFLKPLTNKIPERESLLASKMVNDYLADAVESHGYLLAIAQARAQNQSSSEKIFGVGCVFSMRNGSFTIDQPLANLPADRAGLKEGDVVAAINDVSTDGLEFDDIIDMISGNGGPGMLDLTIIRQGQTLPKITLAREEIIFENVKSAVVTMGQDKIAYLRLNRFSDEQACNIIRDDIRDAEKNGAQEIVLDLRGNLGGLVEQAVCISSLFLGKKKILEQRSLGGVIEENRGKSSAVTQLPMTVLINGYSASASEITAAALQDFNRAYIVGERSYGKGTVQTIGEWNLMESDKSLKTEIVDRFSTKIFRAKTTARFYSPLGRSIQVAGVIPDFVVPSKFGATEEDRFFFREENQFHKFLPAVGEPWKQSRADEVCAISKCIEKAHLEEQVGVMKNSEDLANDYQFRSAVEVLRCAKIVDTLPRCEDFENSKSSSEEAHLQPKSN